MTDKASDITLDRTRTDWLIWPETRAVMAALAEGAGAESQPVARFVGGAVRDAILGRTVEDVDIACALPPEEIMQRLRAAGLKAVPTGIDHGTVTAVAGHRGFEITTLRCDVETFGRHAKVAFTGDWQADAARRDFTINALYADPDGTVFDPVGGMPDLKAGRVRFIGNATERIVEDALRILRFFRFHAWYGKDGMDPQGLTAARAEAARLDILSIERIARELLRLMAAPYPAATVQIMQEAGILGHILPVTDNIDRLEQLQKIDDADPLRRLAALLPSTEQAAETGRYLRLSKYQKARLAGMVMTDNTFTPALDDTALRALLYTRGREYACDHVLLNWAASGQVAGDWPNLLGRVEEFDIPALPLKGADVVTRGIAPGDRVGVLLRQAEARWIAAGLPADRKTALSLLDQVINPDQKNGTA